MYVSRPVGPTVQRPQSRSKSSTPASNPFAWRQVHNHPATATGATGTIRWHPCCRALKEASTNALHAWDVQQLDVKHNRTGSLMFFSFVFGCFLFSLVFLKQKTPKKTMHTSGVQQLGVEHNRTASLVFFCFFLRFFGYF
jgi:hypothetical protein